MRSLSGFREIRVSYRGRLDVTEGIVDLGQILFRALFSCGYYWIVDVRILIFSSNILVF